MKTDNLLLAILLNISMVIFLVGLEVAVRNLKVSRNITRRSAHVVAGLFALIVWRNFSPSIFILSNLVFIGFMSLSQLKSLLTAIHGVSRKTYGEIFLPLGILATYLLAGERPEIFTPAILVMTFADASGGIVSDLRNKGRASWMGSLVFFIVAFSIFSLNGQSFGQALALSFIVAAVEKVSPLGSDNLTVPIATTVLLTL